jgi:hypothetical protein
MRMASHCRWDRLLSGVRVLSDRVQAMDSSHVSLVALLLRADGFEKFRADRNLTLGINIGSMVGVLPLLCAWLSHSLRAGQNHEVRGQ